jgi:PAS domain S-box-containing protein
MIFTQEDRETGAPGAELNTALALGHSTDVRWHLRKDGSAIFCDGTVHKITAEGTDALLGFGKFMRQAYSATKGGSPEQSSAVAEQRSFLAAVLESMDNGIVACDREGKLTFFNDAARELHGLDEAPLHFEQWAEQYNLYRTDGTTPLPLEEVPLYRALQGERVDALRIVIRRANGVPFQVEVSGRPLTDGAGHILGAVVSMHDLTPRHAAETAHAQRAVERVKRIAAEASEDRLRKAQTQLRVATEAAQLGIWTWNVTDDVGSWENARMYEIFKLPSHAVPPSVAVLKADYFHPDDVAAFGRAVDDSVVHGKRFHFIGRFYRSGERALRWVELAGIVQSANADGKVFIIGTAADVTLRKDLEQTVEEARIRLAATLSAGEVATWIWNIDMDRIIGDRNLARLFGIPEEAIANAPLAVYTEAIHPDDAEEVARQLRQAIDSGDAYRAVYRITDRQGGFRWVSARGRVETDAAGHPVLLAGVLLDITPQKIAEAQLRSAEERYRTLITSMDEAFAVVQVLVDAEGRPVDYRFEEVNRAFEQQSGLVDAAGKTIRELVPDIESRWIEVYGRVAVSREPARFTEHSAAMGYWWDVFATPMGEPHERRIAILFTDITARTAADEHLRELAADLSETNRHKTEFLATLAHELRNPLAPMRSGLDLMRIGSRTPAQGGKVLDMMDRQLKQIVHLIDDLMDLSRINSGKIVLKKERIDLGAALANAVEAAMPAIEAAGHVLELHLPDEAILLDADRTRLVQVFGNLLTNAVKYTPNGGRITLSAQCDGDTVQLTVADTGIGIPPEEQARVFDMFSQVSRNMGRAQGGLGIGLSLVRSLVDMHGGTIAVRSEGVGQGTAFTLRFPCVRSAAPELPGGVAPEPLQPAGNRGLRIVLADDNVDAAHLLGDLLQVSGHAAEIVHNGLDAVRRIVETRPDMAILDIGMPGLTGYEVARKIRTLPGLEQTVLVALTGWGGELDRRRSTAAGFDAHLTKPAGLDELSRIINEALRQKAASQPG